jgi:intracellular septation protein A
VLILSFAATAISGLLMFAHIRQVTPVHELMALVMIVASVFHIVLNAKCIGCYLKQKPTLAVVLLAITIAITSFLIMANPHAREGHGGHGPRTFDRD